MFSSLKHDLQVACCVPLRKHCKFAVERSTSEVQSNTILSLASVAPLQLSEIDGGARTKWQKLVNLTYRFSCHFLTR